MGAGRERAELAFAAMMELGVPRHQVKPILKNLLRVYDNNWSYIEADNYHVLADAVFDPPEEQAPSRKEAKQTSTERGDCTPLVSKSKGKRLADEMAVDDLVRFKEPKIEPGSENAARNVRGNAGKRPVGEKEGSLVRYRESEIKSRGEVSTGSVEENADCGLLRSRWSDKRPVDERTGTMVRNKELKVERLTEDEAATAIVPLAMIHPTRPKGHRAEGEDIEGKDMRNVKEIIRENVNHRKATATDVAGFQDPYATNLEIASSSTGEVKLLFTTVCDTSGLSMQTIRAACEMVEDNCLRSYKILGPKFSIMNILKDLCQCAQVLGTETPNKKESGDAETSNARSQSLVVVPKSARGNIRPQHDVNDVTRGEERMRICLVNEVSNEKLPVSFQYIPHNIVYQNAYINFSLARIGDEDCCAGCFGDCLAASIPCACARETGGEYAYTLDGLLKKEFLDDYILNIRDPPRNRYFYCKECPNERFKNEVMPEACKGHLVRRFIKECWIKCGCHKQCGNRVVQHGITCNLQVFYSSTTKGWGLRTVDELPRGTFVCEYVGEILTNTELYERTLLTTGKARHTYPVSLDADWGSEGVLKDEEALCLDATFHGNAARFINHRCFDANLIGVPVEVENPDHHYYHLSFFTTRKVEAFEELTWDYGIDFDDHTHPIKAFRCCCGSRYCRDLRRSTKSKSRLLVLG